MPLGTQLQHIVQSNPFIAATNKLIAQDNINLLSSTSYNNTPVLAINSMTSRIANGFNAGYDVLKSNVGVSGKSYKYASTFGGLKDFVPGQTYVEDQLFVFDKQIYQTLKQFSVQNASTSEEIALALQRLIFNSEIAFYDEPFNSFELPLYNWDNFNTQFVESKLYSVRGEAKLRNIGSEFSSEFLTDIIAYTKDAEAKTKILSETLVKPVINDIQQEVLKKLITVSTKTGKFAPPTDDNNSRALYMRIQEEAAAIKKSVGVMADVCVADSKTLGQLLATGWCKRVANDIGEFYENRYQSIDGMTFISMDISDLRFAIVLCNESTTGDERNGAMVFAPLHTHFYIPDEAIVTMLNVVDTKHFQDKFKAVARYTVAVSPWVGIENVLTGENKVFNGDTTEAFRLAAGKSPFARMIAITEHVI